MIQLNIFFESKCSTKICFESKGEFRSIKNGHEFEDVHKPTFPFGVNWEFAFCETDFIIATETNKRREDYCNRRLGELTTMFVTILFVVSLVMSCTQI